MHHRCLFIACSCACLSLASIAQQPSAAPSARPDGEFLKFPVDGTPWQHPDTDLKFPQTLAGYELKQGFDAKDPEGGIALTYFHLDAKIKADILMTPCPKEVAITVDIMPAAEEQLRGMARALRQMAIGQGYREVEENRGKLERGKIDLWKLGIIPIVQIKMEFVAADATKADSLPALSQWLSVILYQDTWLQTSIVMPVTQGDDGEKLRASFMSSLVQVVREPSVLVVLADLCNEYLADPLSDAGRASADSLWKFSQESPVLEITLPGESLTPALNELATHAPGSEQDVLRAYLVGAGIKTIQGESIDARLAEGARLMTVVYGLLKKKDPKVKSPFLEDLTQLVADNKAVEWLRRRMNAPQTGQ
jgi:hypothetical protein